MIKIINKKEKLKIEEQLKIFDIALPSKHQLIWQSKDKVRIFTGNLSAQEIVKLSTLLKIDNIGLYLSFIKGGEIRLSLDASILYGRNSKRFIELTDKEAKEWLSGNDINKSLANQGYSLLKYGKDILGCGKVTGKKILNFMPKERRIPFKVPI